MCDSKFIEAGVTYSARRAIGQVPTGPGAAWDEIAGR